MVSSSMPPDTVPNEPPDALADTGPVPEGSIERMATVPPKVASPMVVASPGPRSTSTLPRSRMTK